MIVNVNENRLRSIVSICEEQFGFVKGKSTTGVIFALRQQKERYREGQHDLFIDLGKKLRQSSCGRTVLEHARQGVSEQCIRLVKNMCHQCETVVRCAAGTSEPFAVEVGLHQGSVFSPFLFSIMVDSLTEKTIGRLCSQMMWCCAQGRKTCWSWNWSSGGKPWRREE